MLDKSMLRDYIENPLTLLAVRDPKIIAEINDLIPYSTGFEIECDKAASYKEECFNIIPNIMDVNNGSTEQRYRIPNGIMGMICLFQISRQLKYNSLLNPLSGIHYHIDCTDCVVDGTNKIYSVDLFNENHGWVLKELSTWEYKGTYNSKGISVDSYGSTRNSYPSGIWLRSNSQFNTLEFRIGEMTFDYLLLLKRIIHCNDIVRRLKRSLVELNLLDSEPIPQFRPLNHSHIIEYEKTVDTYTTNLGMKMMEINNQLAKMESEQINNVDPLADINPYIRKRLHKLYKDGN